MAEFVGKDLSGARFENVDLSGARFEDVDLSGIRVRNVALRQATLRGVFVRDVEIDGWIEGLTINGVDVMPLVEAELNRREPDRARMRPADADGFREGWAIVQRRWAETVEHARHLPPELLHERVDDEWSFIETQRHLVFATDAWVRRAILGDPAPWDPLDLPHTDDGPIAHVPNDLGARPSLDEVLALRADRQATVSQVLADLTDEQLDSQTVPVLEAGYPESEAFVVRRCLGAILSEEWEHRRYAERDLAVLESLRA